MARGKLFIIEAGDGSGKATQTKLLEERLIAEGRRVRPVEFPDYGSPSSALVRMYLGGDFGEEVHDGNFVCDGLVDALSRPYAGT